MVGSWIRHRLWRWTFDCWIDKGYFAMRVIEFVGWAVLAVLVGTAITNVMEGILGLFQ